MPQMAHNPAALACNCSVQSKAHLTTLAALYAHFCWNSFICSSTGASLTAGAGGGGAGGATGAGAAGGGIGTLICKGHGHTTLGMRPLGANSSQ